MENQEVIYVNVDGMTVAIIPDNNLCVFITRKGDVARTVISKSLTETLLSTAGEIDAIRKKR